MDVERTNESFESRCPHDGEESLGSREKKVAPLAFVPIIGSWSIFHTFDLTAGNYIPMDIVTRNSDLADDQFEKVTFSSDTFTSYSTVGYFIFVFKSSYNPHSLQLWHSRRITFLHMSLDCTYLFIHLIRPSC
ncbi:unnamed protein product [Hymenolepis diminuta]|uniref:Uncharacterized protein n=1 Tax=Hymenolepis diminuta TaxID=6216 RepID=A0A564Z9M3_HYMDI|nr:unnamed protein product [Hymenolepis diminuta]